MTTFGDVISDGLASLQGAVRQYSGPGITNAPGAISALQEAGNAAVAAVGPAIDALSNGSPQVMTITQWAWQKNGVLASSPDLATAQDAVKQMADWYAQAYRLAQSLRASAAATPATSSAPRPVASAPAPTLTPTLMVPRAVAPPVAPKAVSPLARLEAYVPKSPAAGAGILGGAGLGGILGSKLIASAAGGPVGLLLGAGIGWAVTRVLGLK